MPPALLQVTRPRRARALRRDTDDIGENVSGDDRERLDAIERIRDSQTRWERSVMLWREWYDGTEGQHYWETDPYTGMIYQAGYSPDWRSQWSAPDIQSTIDQLTSMNAQVDVKMLCRPMLDSLVAREAAAAGSRVLRAMRRTLRATQMRALASKLAMSDGEAYALPVWDRQLWRPRINVAPCFDILPEPGSETPEDARWVVHDRVEHVDVVRMRWSKPDDASSMDPAIKRRYAEAHAKAKAIDPDYAALHALSAARLQAINVDGATDEQDLQQYVRSADWYDMPSPKFPLGRWFAYCNDVLLFWQDSLPYASIGLLQPAFKVGYRHKPGRFRDISLVQDMMADVKYKERLMNWILDHSLLGTWGKVIVDKGIDTDGIFTTEPHEIIKADLKNGPPQPVQYIRPQPLGAQAMNPVHYITEQMNTRTGVNDPNRGIVNKNTTLGAQQIALAAGQQRAVSFYRDIDELERQCSEAALVMVQAYGDEDSLRNMVGLDRVEEFNAFMQARIVDDGAAARTIEVVAESSQSLSDNAAMREMQVIARMKVGLITPQEGRDQIELPTQPDALTSQREDTRRLLRELVGRAKRGEPVHVSAWWDHATMIEAARQIATQHEYVDATPRQQAEIDALLWEIERVMTERARGAAEVGAPGGGSRPTQPADVLADQGAPVDGQILSPELTKSVTSGEAMGHDGPSSDPGWVDGYPGDSGGGGDLLGLQ